MSVSDFHNLHVHLNIWSIRRNLRSNLIVFIFQWKARDFEVQLIQLTNEWTLVPVREHFSEITPETSALKSFSTTIPSSWWSVINLDRLYGVSRDALKFLMVSTWKGIPWRSQHEQEAVTLPCFSVKVFHFSSLSAISDCLGDERCTAEK